MSAEPEPFDLCCMLMYDLFGYLKPVCARVRIFHSECQRELAMASSELSTSRLPEEDSSAMDSDSDNEVSQIDIDSQISTSSRSSKSAEKRSSVYRRQYAKTFPWATTSTKGSSFAFCMKCSRDINLGRGCTRDLRRHQETKLQTLRKRWCGCTASTVLLWANKRGVCNPCRSTLRIFPWIAPSWLSIGRSLYQTIQVDVS